MHILCIRQRRRIGEGAALQILPVEPLGAECGKRLGILSQ